MKPKTFVGYGTFIYKYQKDSGDFRILGECEVLDFIRIFHYKLPYWYPFVIPKIDGKVKAILYEVLSEHFWDELDRYEGVPNLYIRTICNVLINNKPSKSYIYIPTRAIIKKICSQIDKFTQEEQKAFFSNDLWLEHLANNHPELKKKYPLLFGSVERL